MSLGRTLSVALTGVEGALVRVEADLAAGLPSFTITGLPDAACRQSSERIRAAASNRGLVIPQRRITVNLSPASVPKSGSAFDLPMAVAVLVAAGVIPGEAVDGVVHLGELGLDGSIRAVRGVLPAVVCAARFGVQRVVVPRGNAAEAALVPGVGVVAAETLDAVVHTHVTGEEPLQDGEGTVRSPLGDDPEEPDACPEESSGRDLSEVVGQDEARLAMEIAAAGGHHVFLVGPPGAGKTLLAECLPTILPTLQRVDALEVTAIHSVIGTLPRETLVTRPPFVAPHHGASMAALVGGGSGAIRPGLVSQAHRGVLFLDEAPEFKGTVLQALRQPMESGEVVVARANATARFPARFQLVMAANPCPCGKLFGKGLGCSCTPKARRDYLGRLAGPLLDRVDLRLSVPPITRAMLSRGGGEPSESARSRVVAARARQESRLRGTPWRLNAEIPGGRLRTGSWRLPPQVTAELDRAVDRGWLSLRGYDRVIRVARTIADLRGDDPPGREEVGLALSLRANSEAAA